MVLMSLAKVINLCCPSYVFKINLICGSTALWECDSNNKLNNLKYIWKINVNGYID